MIHKLQLMKTLIMLVFTLLLVACGGANPEPIATGFPASTLSPVSTTQPYTISPISAPSDTPIPDIDISFSSTPVLETTATVSLPIPSGKPVTSWKDIPVIPDAIAGEEKEGGYSYTTKATSEQVQDYYNSEMLKKGWEFFATGKGETGSLLLMYQKDGKTTTVSIFEQGDLTIVLLIQY